MLLLSRYLLQLISQAPGDFAGPLALPVMSRVDWPLAVSVAASVSGRYPLEDTYHQTRLERDLPELVTRASALVSDETRTRGARVSRCGRGGTHRVG